MERGRDWIAVTRLKLMKIRKGAITAHYWPIERYCVGIVLVLCGIVERMD